MRSGIPPAGWLALALGCQAAVGRGQPTTVGSRFASAVVGTGSAWLIAGSFFRFRRSGTTVNPVNPDATSLVTSGPNRITRNPMYVGMAGILVAHAVLRRSQRALVPAALFIAIIDRLQIPGEEAALRLKFGGEFEKYMDTTPRWIGATCAPRHHEQENRG